MNPPRATPTRQECLPLVVQIGFAGSRVLLDETERPGIAREEFERLVEGHLTECLRRLPAELGIEGGYFLCAISQAAIGADLLFLRSCRTLHISNYILLPQPLDAYLAAASLNGSTDFDDQQRHEARELVSHPNVIQIRTVSNAGDRISRFEDVNLEIVRSSDVIICLRPADAPNKPGGTTALLELAERHQRAVLDVQISVENSAPVFRAQWHRKERFKIPLPPELPMPTDCLEAAWPAIKLPTLEEYSAPLKAMASRQSRRVREFFKRAAFLIIGAHVAATICATTALLLHGASHESNFIRWLLGGELVLLAGGLWMHHHLHHSQAAGLWANSRLISEIVRSTGAASLTNEHLEHLFALPFPQSIHPLLRTLNFLHLSSIRFKRTEPWKSRRDAYIRSRLSDPDTGQIAFYRHKVESCERWLSVARRLFYSGACIALTATTLKLLVTSHLLHVPQDSEALFTNTLGALAVIMPVIAVAALSLAASFDLEALTHSYRETLQAIESQLVLLKTANSEREFVQLVIDTESRLLGETSVWASRRSFKGVD